MRSVHESDRIAIGWQLHDEIGQKLAAFRMACFGIAQRLSIDGNEAALQEAHLRAADELKTAIPLLDEAIRSVQELTEDLRPAILQFGPAAAIEWQAERFQSRSGIACVADVSADVDLSGERTLALFLVFTEALTDAASHEGTTIVDVTLRRDGGDVVLRVCGDGPLPVPGESISHDLALLTMRERARSFGGTLALTESAIEVRIPRE